MREVGDGLATPTGLGDGDGDGLTIMVGDTEMLTTTDVTVRVTYTVRAPRERSCEATMVFARHRPLQRPGQPHPPRRRLGS